jgi:hypothetical protein
MKKPGLAEQGFIEAWHNAFISDDHWHFHRRLLERYKFILGPGEFNKILTATKVGTALLIKAKKGGTGIYWVRLNSKKKLYVLAKGHRLLSAWPRSKEIDALRRSIETRRKG